MPIESDLRNPQFARTVFAGVVTRAEFLDYVQRIARLSDDKFPHVTLVDLSPMQEAQFGSAEIWPHVRELTARRVTLARQRVEVLLAPSMHAYGIARMFQTLVGDSFRVEVFRDANSARKRLLELSGGSWSGDLPVSDDLPPKGNAPESSTDAPHDD